MRNFLFHLTLVALVVTPKIAYADENLIPQALTCGVIVPLSGKVAEWGIWAKGGIEIARKSFEDESVQFVYEDDQYTPNKTISAVRKLLDVDKINCLITVGSSTSLAIQNIAEEAKIPMFTIAITPKVGAGLAYVIRYYIPIKRQIDGITQEIAKRAYKKIAILTSEHDATLPLAAELIKANVVDIVFNEQVVGDEQAAASLALRVKAAAPDAVFLNLIAPMPSTFARRLREIGYKGEFFSGPTLESVEEVKAAHGALEGAWFVTVDDSKALPFISEYQRRFNGKPGMLALYAHDIAKIILTKPKSIGLIEYAKSLKEFTGVAGAYGWNGKEFDIPAGVWRISGESFTGPGAQK